MAEVLWTNLATILCVWVVVVIMPGPNFFTVTHTALTQSARLALMVVLGIAAGTVIWATVSLLGLGLLFRTASRLYTVIKLVGAAYLIYIGLKTIWTAGKYDRPEKMTEKSMSAGKAFRRGLLVDLSNPKVGVFFTSLFAVTVPPEAPWWYKVTAVCLVAGAVVGWYSTVACLLNIGPVSDFFSRSKKVLSYITGTVFLGLGIKLAQER